MLFVLDGSLRRSKLKVSAGAEGAVDTSSQISDGSLSHKALQEFSLFAHVVHLLLQHGAHGDVVVVVQRCPLLGQIVAEACQADFITQ